MAMLNIPEKFKKRILLCRIPRLGWVALATFRSTKKAQQLLDFSTGDEGFEPPSTVLETGALPLN